MDATVLWSTVSAIGAALIAAGASYYAVRLPARAKLEEAQRQDENELSRFRHATSQWLETVEGGMASLEGGEADQAEKFDEAVHPFREAAEELFHTNRLLRRAATGQRVLTVSQLIAAQDDQSQCLPLGERASRTLAALRCMTNEVRTDLASGNPRGKARQEQLAAALEGARTIRTNCVDEIRALQSQAAMRLAHGVRAGNLRRAPQRRWPATSYRLVCDLGSLAAAHMAITTNG